MKIRNLLRTAALTAATFLLWTGVGWGQEIVAAWTFPTTTGNETVNIAAECGTMSGSSIIYADGTNGSSNWLGTTGAVAYFGGAIPASSLCGVTTTTGAASFVNLGSAFNGSGIVYKISLTGYENLTLTYDTRGTATGFASHEWLYSTNGVDFTSVTTIPGRNVTTFSNQVVDFSSISAIDNQTNVYIKVILSGASGTGNNRFDNVIFSATVLSGPDTEAPVATFAPLNSSTDVAIDVVPSIAFDEAIRNIDDSEITDINVADLLTFTDPSKGAVPFTATIDAEKKLITITPTAALANEVVYTIGLAPVEDALDNASILQTATFTTIAASTPTLELTSTHTGPYYAGDEVTVTWTATNLLLVDVEAWVPSVGDWLPMNEVDIDATLGTFTFTIPADAQFSAAYMVRVKNAEDVTPVSESPAFTVRAVAMDLATIRAYAVNDEFRFDGEAFVTFTRPAGAPGYNQKFLVDETAGLLIHDASTVITTPYVIGDGMSGLLAKRAVYNQLAQIVPLADPGAPISTGNEIVPEVKTLAAITSDDQGKLVKVNGVTFTAPGTFAAGQNYTITDASKGSMAFRTQFAEADYIGQPIPTNQMDLVMLVGQFNATIQLTTRSLEDFALYYQLNVVAGANGEVSSAGGLYLEAEEVELTAVPNFGYKFTNWTDGEMVEVSTENPFTVTMPAADLTLTANFEAIPPIVEFPWNEGFEDGMANWSLLNPDGSATSWVLETEFGHGSTNSAVHIYGDEDFDEEGWLVSPQLILPGGWPGMVLKFWSYNVDSDFYGKNSVLISTGSGNPADGQFVEVWSPSEVAEEEWTETAINLGMYSGQPIYIAFKYEGNWAHVWVVDDISVAQFQNPTITPEGAIFSISQPEDVEFDINWGSEVEITTLYYRYWDEGLQQDVEEPMVLGDDYVIVENTLTISTTFILDNYSSNNGLNFRAEFGMDSESWFYIEVVFSTIPTITPTAVNYDLTNPGDVFTTIVWANAESITSVSVGGTPLVLDTDYRIQTGQLFINNNYLSTALLLVDDSFDALITFNTSDEETLTVTAIESGVVNATIAPQFVEYPVMPASDNFTITWNDASAVTGIHVFVTMQSYFMEFDLVEGSDYVVTDNGNGTANLEIFFGEKKTVKEYEQIMEVVAAVSFDAGAPANIYMTITETYYEITVNVNPIEAGNVNNVWDGYQAGEEVELYANTNFGYIFINWTDAEGVELSTDQNYIFTMPASDLTLNANFSPIFNVTFNVVDALSNPINDAVVTFDGVTSEPGDYFFNEIMPGEYDYTITKEGYVTVTGTATVIDADLSIDIIMEEVIPTYTVTFNVVDEVSAPIADAIITFDGTTAPAGEYVFTNLVAGAYDYTVAKDGFVDVVGIVTVVDGDLVEPIVLFPVGLNTNTFANFSAFPNPFGERITLSNPAAVNRVIVANIIGQNLMDVNTNGAATIETSKLPKGVYLVTFEAANGERIVRKMIKK